MTQYVEEFHGHSVITSEETVSVNVVDKNNGEAFCFVWKDDNTVAVTNLSKGIVLGIVEMRYLAFLKLFIDIKPNGNVVDNLPDFNTANPNKTGQPKVLVIKNMESRKIFFQVIHSNEYRATKDVKLLLDNDSHWNKHLQNSYNKHGEDAFTFGIYPFPQDLDLSDDSVLNSYMADQKRYFESFGWQLYNFKSETDNW